MVDELMLQDMNVDRAEIDREVEAQRLNIETARSALDAKRSEFGQLVQKYGMSGAEQLWGAAHAERLAAQASQVAAQNGIAQSDVNLQKTVAALAAAMEKTQPPPQA